MKAREWGTHVPGKGVDFRRKWGNDLIWRASPWSMAHMNYLGPCKPFLFALVGFHVGLERTSGPLWEPAAQKVPGLPYPKRGQPSLQSMNLWFTTKTAFPRSIKS